MFRIKARRFKKTIRVLVMLLELCRKMVMAKMKELKRMIRQTIR